LARQGCRLIYNGWADSDTVTRLADEFRELSGHEALFWPADLSRGAELLGSLAELPRVDILVNNAGIQHTAPVHEFAPEKWEAVLAINLSSSFYTTHALLPGMLANGWGRIINIASVHGVVASVNKAAYVAAKHGVIGLTKVVALEQARGPVTCNAICPGWVLTPLVEQQIHDRAAREGISVEQAQSDLLLEKQPSGRFTSVEQLGELVTFLCSSGADNITGATLPVDGGWLAQ
jgi:3-hydroxybutyrate dehydrogenase